MNKINQGEEDFIYSGGGEEDFIYSGGGEEDFISSGGGEEDFISSGGGLDLTFWMNYSFNCWADVGSVGLNFT